MSEPLVMRLEKKTPLIGPIMTLASPEIAEMLVGVGYDWIFIDMEHTTLSVQNLQHIVQAVADRCYCVVRAPSDDEAWIKKLLDTGVDGIIIPHVDSVEMAERIVHRCKYSPDGARSAGISRAHGYGLSFNEYVQKANRSVAVILQIEDIHGVAAVDEIVRLPGVSGIFVGPYDLSASMNMLGQVSDPAVQNEIKKVQLACENAGLPIGIFGINAEAVQPYIGQGFTIIAMGFDTTFFIRGAKDELTGLKRKN